MRNRQTHPGVLTRAVPSVTGVVKLLEGGIRREAAAVKGEGALHLRAVAIALRPAAIQQAPLAAMAVAEVPAVQWRRAQGDIEGQALFVAQGVVGGFRAVVAGIRGEGEEAKRRVGEAAGQEAVARMAHVVAETVRPRDSRAQVLGEPMRPDQLGPEL